MAKVKALWEAIKEQLEEAGWEECALGMYSHPNYEGYYSLRTASELLEQNKE